MRRCRSANAGRPYLTIYSVDTSLDERADVGRHHLYRPGAISPMSDSRPSHPDPRLLPDRPFNTIHAPRIFAHTVYSHVRDHRPSPPGHSLSRTVFIVGSPRSGTTFLGSAMSRIPGVTYQFEPVAVKAAVPYIYFGLWHDARGRSVVTRTHRLLKAIGRETDRTLVEKTPRNVFIAEHLSRWYPDALFIGLIRDGRDVATSWAQRPWFGSEIRQRRFEPGGYRYGPRPHFWVEAERISEFERATTLHRCMWGWRAHTEGWINLTTRLPRSRRVEVRYEDLVQRSGDTANRLAEFLDLDDIGSRSLHKALGKADPRSVGKGKTESISEPTALAEGKQLLERLDYL